MMFSVDMNTEDIKLSHHRFCKAYKTMSNEVQSKFIKLLACEFEDLDYLSVQIMKAAMFGFHNLIDERFERYNLYILGE